jgi:uncharacterized membrane protein YeiH
MPILGWLPYLDYGALLVFAATGALVAARGRHDFVTFLFFAALTGVGGGTLRDLLIGAPVFWVKDPTYLLGCVVASAAIWFGGRWLDRPRALLWLDGIGLAFAATMGAAKAVAFGVAWPVCIVMGVLSATAGGMVRDVLAARPSILLSREIYVTAALITATVYVAATSLGAPPALAIMLAFVIGFAVRAGAIALGWALPSYRDAGKSDA